MRCWCFTDDVAKTTAGASRGSRAGLNVFKSEGLSFGAFFFFGALFFGGGALLF